MAALGPVTMSDPSSVEVWEEALYQEIVRTVKEVWTFAGKPARVLLAVDGVVPSAKIRQQRVRRFKSAWLRSSATGWDSNSITPGTDFMKRLTIVLEGVARSHGKGWTVSGVEEAGEGEHKVMRWLKKNAVRGETSVVYGLDADLILLSMLAGETSGSPIWLLREKQEFGSAVDAGTATGDQEYTYMNIEECKRRMGLAGQNDIINYIALMSLMGNDFLPHSLTHKLNDDGHDCVIEEFNTMKRTGKWLVVDEQLQNRVLLDICKRWSSDEDRRMEKMIGKKREQAGRGVAKGMDPSEALPLEWNVEKCMMVGSASAHGQARGRVTLSPGWRTEYWGWIHPNADRDSICSEYVFGCQWIIDYYLGKEVDMMWMFPSWIPPLWSDLARWLADASLGPKKQQAKQEPIRPEEQLAMVLPLDSWGLVRDPRLRRLPALAIQMWPRKFSFFSAGRRWLWECEARVPVLTAERLRDILDRTD
jgi:5'-3' exonuclease